MNESVRQSFMAASVMLANSNPTQLSDGAQDVFSVESGPDDEE
jgi:hypothetical protein